MTTSRPIVYLSLIALEYGLAVFALARLRAMGKDPREMVHGLSRSINILRDLLLAAALWAAWLLIARVWSTLSPAPSGAVVQAVLPRTAVEAVLWVALSVSAGIAEELAFRGWLQSWVFSRTGSWTIAVLAQAVVFGIVHGYQGLRSVLRIAAYGTLFGAVTLWRRGLRPVMIAHAWTDIAAGLLRI